MTSITSYPIITDYSLSHHNPTSMKRLTKSLATLAAIAAATVLPFASCGDKERLQQAEATNDLYSSQLQSALATQDSLFMLINEITDGMNQIKEMERVVATSGTLSSETPSAKNQLVADMQALQQALQSRRERLEELEKKLADSSGQNANLLKTISNLKAQIAEQQTEIVSLNDQLAQAGMTITNLGSQIDSLNQTVTTVVESLDQAEQAAQAATAELNTCYYVVGSDKELKDNNIIEKGFLRKTKILPGDFNASYFTPADKRTLTEINTHSKKAEVMTNQPKDSYSIEDQGGQKIIRITNPTRFWSVSNYLVVKVD